MPIETWLPLAVYYEDVTAAAAHKQALLDAVIQYREDSPKRELNPDAANECAPGLNTGDRGILNSNPLNCASVSYEPKEARRILFPSKTPHSVQAGNLDGLRVLLSYDVAFTAREDEVRPFHEFLLPSPTTWRRFAPMASSVEEESATLAGGDSDE